MNGILIVDKPKGMTSHDVVNFLRRRFGIKKVGHAGTLDPMATGVLVMLLGSYTKASPEFTKDDKEYEATMVLGAVSDTGDACGNIKGVGNAGSIDEAAIRRVFGEFLGEISQTPPMYSAVKVDGKRLYKLARKGLKVEVSPRKILIKNIELIEFNPPRAYFRVACSKGTYIRQLSQDIGERLGCGAYLSELRRTISGRFKIGDAVSIGDLGGLTSTELERMLHA